MFRQEGALLLARQLLAEQRRDAAEAARLAALAAGEANDWT